MPSKKTIFLFGCLVMLVGILFRFYLLGQVPHGMTWDEAAIGYNGFAIINTRRDEWLERLPLSFRSFGDYKAPLAIYINGISTRLFGMSLWAVRLPFALSGVLAIIAFGILVYLLLRKEKSAIKWALIGSILLAFNPWHIHFSRIGFESGMSLFFALWGWVSLLYLLQFRRVKIGQLLILVTTTAVFLAAAVYTYHSPKIVVPIVTLLLIWYQVKTSRQQSAIFMRSFLVFIMSVAFVFPLVKDMFFANGGARMAELVFFQDKSTAELWQLIIHNAWVQLGPRFLLAGATSTLRHGGKFWGYLYPTTFLFALLGVAATFYKRLRLFALFAIALIVVGSLPAILGSEVPHSNRGLFALPGYLLLAIAGGKVLFAYLKQKQSVFCNSIIGITILLHIFFIIAFTQQYFRDFAQASAVAFQDGYLQAFRIAQKYEQGVNGKPKVDKILFSSVYGQPYIYALFVRQTNPIWYRGGSLNKYEFTDKISAADLSRKNTLIVATPDQNLPIDQASQIISGSDGSIRFEIYVTQ